MAVEVIKSIIIYSLLIQFSIPVHAQTQKGSKLAGGSVRFNFDNVKQEINGDNSRVGTETTLQFTPKAAYFVDDAIAVGAMLNWQREAFKDNDDDRKIDHSFSVGPFARYYTALGPFFHLQMEAGGGASKVKPEVGDESTKNFSIWSYGAGLGYPYFLGDHISLEPVVMFRSLNKREEDKAGEEITLKHRGLMIQLGLVYYFF